VLGILGYGLNEVSAITAQAVIVDRTPVGYLKALHQPLFWVVVQFVILGPLYETFVSQWLVYKLVRMRRKYTWLFIPLSAVIFGAAHWLSSSLAHACVATVFGLYLASIYLWVDRDRADISPFAMTWIVHAVNNLLGLIVLLA
jgi:hypothetical protein